MLQNKVESPLPAKSKRGNTEQVTPIASAIPRPRDMKKTIRDVVCNVIFAFRPMPSLLEVTFSGRALMRSGTTGFLLVRRMCHSCGMYRFDSIATQTHLHNCLNAAPKSFTVMSFQSTIDDREHALGRLRSWVQSPESPCVVFKFCVSCQDFAFTPISHLSRIACMDPLYLLLMLYTSLRQKNLH